MKTPLKLPSRTTVRLSEAPRVHIRPFRPAHLKRILEIEAAAFADQPYDEEMFLDLYHNCADLFFVARAEGAIIGYIVTCITRGRAEVVSIAVDPANRNFGVGTAMMRRTLERLKEREIRRVDLMVRTTNYAGLSFYRGFGFTKVKKVDRYYHDGANAYLMKKLL